MLHGVVVVGDAVVVVLAREGNAVLGRGDFFAQGGKLVVRFEVGVVFKGGVKAAEARAKGLFGSGKFADARCAAAGVFQGVRGVVTRGDDAGQGFLFVLQVFARNFNEVGDKVITAGKLYVDLCESIFVFVALVDEAVVDADGNGNGDDDESEDNPASHGFSPCFWWG